MDKDPLMQYLTSVAQFSGEGMGLMHATVVNILEGKEINMQHWQDIATAYEELASSQTALSLDFSNTLPEAEAIGKFAQFLCTPDLHTAYDSVEYIPADPEFTLPRLLAKVIIAEQRTKLYPDQPVERLELAKSYYALIPHANTVETLILGLRRTVETSREVLRYPGRENTSDKVMQAASLFVGLSNELAAKLKTPDYIMQALDLGEDLLKANPFPSAPVMPHICALANNLVRTCHWLITNTPYHKVYYEKGLAFATRARKTVDALLNLQIASDSYLFMQEMSISAFALLNTYMATVSSVEFDRYAYTAYQCLQEYKLLTFEYRNERATQRYRQLEESMYELLHAAQPDWQIPDLHTPDSPSFDLTRYIHVEPILEQVRARVDEIVAQADRAQQFVMVASTLDFWYTELASQFPPIIAEVGLNYYVCRLILALGAVTSGQIGNLILSAIASWVLHLEVPDPNSPKIAASQQWPAVYHTSEISSIIAILQGIVELIEASREIPSLEDTIIPMLRKHNSTLLQNLLPGIRIQQLDSKLQTDINDLALLFRAFPEAAKKRGLETYTSVSSSP